RQMPELIKGGKIHLAQPPLFMVSRGKKSQYVLNESKMSDVLTELAVSSAVLVIRDEQGREKRRIEGESLQKLIRMLNRLQELVKVAERRGTSFPALLAARAKDPLNQHRLPTHRLVWPDNESLFWSEDDASAFIQKQNLILDDLGSGDGEVPGRRRRLATLRELHENREIAKVIERLQGMGINIEDYSLVQ